MKKCVLALVVWAVAAVANAGNQPYETFGNYKVYYTVFNSSFIKPDVARIYNLTRGKNQVLVNVSLVKRGEQGDSLGLAAKVEGTATNLMQQQRTLKFKEISEQNTVYYLAPLRVSDEEVMNFRIQVQPTEGGRPLVLEFSKTMYVER